MVVYIVMSSSFFLFCSILLFGFVCADLYMFNAMCALLTLLIKATYLLTLLYFALKAVRNIVMSMCVCLSVCPLAKLENHMA